MDNQLSSETHCWVTLITKPSYLPGVIILAYSLDKHGSSIPLIVQYSKSLGPDGISALATEAKRSGRIVPNEVELLIPRKGQENVGAVADRFKDTFTKLRAFEVFKLGFTKSCFLDADMAVFGEPDSIFDVHLPQRNWIAANHPCVCNLDHDSWAPEEWNKGNCAYTALSSSRDVFNSETRDSRPTYQEINGGMFLFHPSQELWTDLITSFDTSHALKDYQLPDQDFLADFFKGRQIATSWRYNAMKTMRYVHPALWSDDEVIFLHYIVDKPWDRPLSASGIAGHLGRDGETHRWWRTIYEDWLCTQKVSIHNIVDYMKTLVDTQEPFTEFVPLTQSPGCLEDIPAYTTKKSSS